jgi:hypothetical protein
LEVGVIEDGTVKITKCRLGAEFEKSSSFIPVDYKVA